MFQDSHSDAEASTDCGTIPSPAFTLPPSSSTSFPETVRHLLFGHIGAMQHTIKLLHKLNYAKPNDWSRLMPTG